MLYFSQTQVSMQFIKLAGQRDASSSPRQQSIWRTSPKSNSTYKAINKAQELVNKTGDLPVPLHIRNAPTQLMKELGYGNDYQYPHDFKEAFTLENYMPEKVSGETLWHPSDNLREKEIKERMNKLWKGHYKF